MFITSDKEQALQEVAQELKIPSKWLHDLIQYESRHDPLKANKTKGQSAKGLIQFIDKTAVWLGYSSSQNLIDTHPEYIDQLKNPVLTYLKKWAPFKDNVEFYNSVFRPGDRFTPNRVFSEKVQEKNSPYGIPIKTPLHYMAYVEGKLREFDRGEVTAKDLYEKNPYDESAPKKVKENATVDTNEERKKKALQIAGLTIGVVGLYYLMKSKS